MKTSLIKYTVSFVVLVLIVSIGIPLIVTASDITDAVYCGDIVVTNNGTAASNVATLLSENLTPMKSVYDIDDAWDYMAIISSSGADVPFMPGYGSNPTCLFVPSIAAGQSLDNILYTGYSDLLCNKAYFPGSAGMSVSDAASLEPGANFTIQMNDTFIDTTAGVGKVILTKPEGISIGVDQNINGKINIAQYPYYPYYDSFATDPFTNVNPPKISVNTTAQRLNYESEESAVDTRCYYDMLLISNISWKLQATINNTTTAGAAGNVNFGIFSAATNWNGYAGDALAVHISHTGANPSVFIARSDGGAAAFSSPISLVNGTSYYITFERNTDILATLSVYSDSSRTTHIAGSPVTLAIPATVTNLRYLQCTNYADGSGTGKEITGWIDDVIISKIYFSVSNIPSAEYDLRLSADSTNIALYLNGISQNSTAIGAGIPNVSNNWTFGSGNTTSYIGAMSVTVGGNTRGQWEWEYGATFTDLSGNGNTGTPSFRTTSSDPDVSASLTSFAPITLAIPPPFDIATAPVFITNNVTMQGQFSTGNVSSTGGPPGFSFISEIAAAGKVPNIWLFSIIATCIVVAGHFFWIWMQRRFGFRTMWPFFITGLIVFGLLVALGGTVKVFDFWMVFFYILLFFVLMTMSRHTEVGGNVSTHGLIGFAAQSWIGLTIINKMLGAAFVGATETSWVNNFAFTQDFKLFDIFSIPVLNTDFWTVGIPSLIRWDYSFFGGNAQMFQYLLYTLTAVIAFVMFGLLIGLLYNFFK